MKNVIIIGASGMIGSIILRECLASKDVSQVTSITRKSSGISHPKLKEMNHSDFNDYSQIKELFEEKDIAYYCLGVYTGAVPREEFRKITVDFTATFSREFAARNPQGTFCFLSGQGADIKEKSKMMFAQDKGIAENQLKSLKMGRLHIFRPAYIYPVEARDEPNLSYRIMRWVYPLFKNISSGFTIPSEQLGKAMFRAGFHDVGMETLENTDIKKITL